MPLLPLQLYIKSINIKTKYSFLKHSFALKVVRFLSYVQNLLDLVLLQDLSRNTFFSFKLLSQ